MGSWFFDRPDLYNPPIDYVYNPEPKNTFKTREEISTYNYKALRCFCRIKKLGTKGLKRELEDRVWEYLNRKKPKYEIVGNYIVFSD
jgi:hypothetical protein